MGKTCNFELWEQKDEGEKETCGFSADSTSPSRCAFHKTVDKALPLTKSSIIADYIWKGDHLHPEHRKRGYLDLTKMRFRGISFNRVLLPADIDIRFDNSEFEDCEFLGLDFQKYVSFRECVFTHTPFDNVNIEAKGIDFSLATFSEQAVQFAHCDFRCTDGILFTQAHIESTTTTFRSCYFQAPKVSFKNCTLDTDRLYVLIVDEAHQVVGDRYLVLDSEQIYFDDLSLNGHFEYANYLKCKAVSPIVLFSQVNFRHMKTATFLEANLKRARFTYSVLHNVEFRNPQFEESSGRKQIFDEIVPVGNTDDEHIRDVYIQLKRNYEEAHNYSDAGDWFYREMECRRRLARAHRVKHPWLGLPATILYNLYKIVSEYGENYARPLWGLIITLVIGAISFFYSGFDIGSGPVSYDLVCDVTWESAEDFANALFYSFGIMSFQLTKTAFQHGIASSTLAVTQILLTLILVPLFLLALRRKFRR